MIETTNATHDVPAAAQPTIIVGADLPRVSAVDAARTIASGGTATLATLTADPPGFPFGSLVSYAVDATGNPLFFISELAEHTRNLRADSRASLLATEPQPGTDGLATFADVVDRAELSDALDNGDALTVFAPTDDAFGAIPPNVLTSVLDDPDLVATIVAYHVVAADDDLDDRAEVATVCAEIETDNGTIIVIDRVLMPPTDEAVPGSSSSTPGSSVPAFGPDEQAVATAFQTAVDSSLGYDEQAPFIEDAEEFRATIENYPVAAEAVLGISAVVTDVTIDGDTATISYVLHFNDVEAPYGELDGSLIKVDGGWLIPREAYCAFQGQARNSCPA